MSEPSSPEHQPLPPVDVPVAGPRREFLKASAAAAGAALLSSCFGGSGGGEDAPLLGGTEVDPLSRFDHLVVVMFENRSFDNLLGYLYSQGMTPADWPSRVPVPPPVPAGQSFDGLFGKVRHSDDGVQKIYAHPHDFAPGSVTATDWTHPAPDPGEGLAHTATQLAGGKMTGFVDDYRKKHKDATADEVSAIMGSYAPAHLSVLSGLAQQFAVFDHWYCAVPSETYCNRSFFHASTSSGFVENEPKSKWSGNTAPTIFDRLEAGSPAPKWKVYFEKPASESERQTYPYGLTGLVHPEVSRKYPEKFVEYAKFAEDIARGTLPAYSFVERVYGGHDDFHPPGDVRNGEEVLRQIYEAIRTSGTLGPHDYTQDTLLLVVFDEHGGTYDHVAPPATGVPAPSNPPVAGELGYDFTSLGLRVPAIAISAYAPAGTVVNTPVHHAAVIRTLCRKYGLPALTDRDRDPNGGDLSGALGAAAPRAAASWPAFPNPVSPPAG
jgi:phospholipase C